MDPIELVEEEFGWTLEPADYQHGMERLLTGYTGDYRVDLKQKEKNHWIFTVGIVIECIHHGGPRGVGETAGEAIEDFKKKAGERVQSLHREIDEWRGHVLDSRWDLYEKADEQWETEAQLHVMIGEIGEFLDELFGKRAQGRENQEDIIDELADVMLMLEQFQQIVGREKVDKRKQQKVQKFKEKLC